MQIVRLVVNGGMETVVAGLLIGGVGHFFVVRLLRSLLFGVAPFDPLSFMAAAIVLVVTVLLAGLGPAGRAGVDSTHGSAQDRVIPNASTSTLPRETRRGRS